MENKTLNELLEVYGYTEDEYDAYVRVRKYMALKDLESYLELCDCNADRVEKIAENANEIADTYIEFMQHNDDWLDHMEGAIDYTLPNEEEK